MTGDLKALWASVVADPLDAAPKLVLADWLQERDLDPDLERGLRYCAMAGKWPEENSRYQEMYGNTYSWSTFFGQWPTSAVILDDKVVNELMSHTGRFRCRNEDKTVCWSGFRFNHLVSSTPAVAVRRLGAAIRRAERQKVAAGD